MNQDQLLGTLRTLVAVVGGYALGHGWLTSDQVTLVGGVVLAVAPLVWSYFSHTDSAKLAAVAKMPDIKNIIAFPNATNQAVKDAVADDGRPKIKAAA